MHTARVRPLLLLLLIPLLALSPTIAQDTGPAPGEGPGESPPPKPDEAPDATGYRPPTDLPGTRQGDADREGMWPAPTAEDWSKPVLITFQRTWEDALAVSKETGKPILICVNMDGEIASEHYAGVRYRQPEVAKLYEPYVCVIASTYRHNPKDHDEEGNRILCPRFGSVTCGEHIWIEPILFEKFFDGERVAPRHVMVELDGSESYDRYYVNDTAGVFESIHKGIATRTRKPHNIVRGDKPIVERVASRDIVDRRAVEKAYREGDGKQRKSLLEAALAQGRDAPLDLLRMAVFGLDTEMSAIARSALAKAESKDATDLINDALRVPMPAEEKDALIGALERIGKGSPKAKWLAVVHRGLGVKSDSVDAKKWAEEGRGGTARWTPDWIEELEAKRQYLEKAHRGRPDDPELTIALAEASLDLARRARTTRTDDLRMARILARHMFADARRYATKAAGLKATPWRVNAVLGLVAYYGKDMQVAYEYAGRAVRALPPGDGGWNSMAVLTIFAEGRFKAIKSAAKENRRWPARWLTDVDAAYSALLHHPLATVGQVLWHHEFMQWLGVKRKAIGVLARGIERFPDSAALHRQFRKLVIEVQGTAELESAYARLLRQEDPHPNLVWFAAFASKVAAQTLKKQLKGEEAMAAYGRAIALFERAIEANPNAKASVDVHIATSLAGQARIAYEMDDDAKSTELIVAALTRSPGSAATVDGSGVTPAETAQMLMARLVEREKADLAATLESALAKIAPELLKPREE
ncbi:MAG: hypothetical protein ABFS86_05015 [Planctomycetota bacterium]